MTTTRNKRTRAVLGSVLGALVIFSASWAFAAPTMTVDIGGEAASLSQANWTRDGNKLILVGNITATNQFGSFTIFGGPLTYADPDPELSFSASATNSTAGIVSYSFSFNTPLVPSLSGLISSHAELGVTLTDAGSNGATVAPISSNMLNSYDFYSNQTAINKNVNIGDLISIVGPTTTTNFSADNSLFCSQACVAMSSILSFSLSGGDSVGFSGKVVQVAPVPLPGAVLLFGSGLLGLAGALRKKFSLA